MGRLDALLDNHSENTRALTVKLSMVKADSLKDIAKYLGLSRQKLIQECFDEGLRIFEEKFAARVTSDEPTEV